MKNNGIKRDELSVTEDALRDIVRYYTREAGVRSAGARDLEDLPQGGQVAGDEEARKNKVVVNAKNLDKFLGVRRYSFGMAEKDNQIGQVTGSGMDRGRRRTADHRGRGPARQGQDHDHRQARRGDAGVDPGRAVGGAQAQRVARHRPDDFYQKNDIHIHLPEGATPKDGPSPASPSATALVSVLTGIPVRATSR
jgi:ATP-dependent Lon protease